MTARQRQAPGSPVAPIPAEAAKAEAGLNGDDTAFRWEAWFAAASPDQRAEALALARRQGLLYCHQLPPTSYSAHRAPTAESTLAPLIARLLTAEVDNLPPIGDEPIEGVDTQLDPVQREAVRRALNTPDLFLLQGIPGTGKSRVLVEVIVQAARRGWRVLLVAPSAPAVDVVLERLAGCSDVLPIRMLAPDENVAALPPWLAALTLMEQRRAFRVQAQQGARRARQQAEETCGRRQREQTIWPQLMPLSERQTALSRRRSELEKRIAAVPGEVEREAVGLPGTGKGLPSGPFAAEVVELHRRTAKVQTELEADQKIANDKGTHLRVELAAIAAQLAALAPKCRAREQHRWWTLAYWTGGSALARRDGLQAQQARLEAERKTHDQELAALDERRRQMEEQQRAELADLIGGETERRQHELSVELAGLKREVAELNRAWEPLCQAIAPVELQPERAEPAYVATARERWEAQCRRDEEGCRFARQWADYLDEASEQLASRVPALANLLAGPMAAMTRGREGNERTAAPFDLLIIEEADTLTEADLKKLAGHAPRLLLVGEALGDSTPSGNPSRSTTTALTGCWPRLWDAVADDLGQLPYTWQREGGRLFCNLATVRLEDARYLERENLADAPEIELSILSLPRCRPLLARVSFPGTFTIPQGTAFICRELQELPVQPLGRTAWWEVNPQACVLHLGPAQSPATDAVDLGSGVQMGLIADGLPYAGRAARIDFARDAGFDLATARRWLATHLRTRDRQRAVFLQVPYRMRQPLADVVGPLLFPESCLGRLLELPMVPETPFEFVAVPALRRAEWPREGAGLEQDLSAGRLGDRLPSDLRGQLPRKGVVNYLEAQALIQRLERWAHAPNELPANSHSGPSVLVLALSEAQAELLRRLAHRSAALQKRPFPLEIAVPGKARQRECDVLVLSLTRSHAHRCVPFGEDAADLARALTRPRQRLLVFGDPGALVKRTHWQGPLDHLDAAAAHIEGQRVGRLLRHLQAV